MSTRRHPASLSPPGGERGVAVGAGSVRPGNGNAIVRLCIALCVLLALPAEAGDRKLSRWKQFDSEHFVVFSDASAGKSRAVATELELLRAAAALAVGLQARESDGRVRVLFFDSEEEFRRVRPERYADSFWFPASEGPVVVATARFNYRQTRVQVRRAYARLLLQRGEWTYPTWYVEGLAALISTIEFHDRNTAFSLGTLPSGSSGRYSLPGTGLNFSAQGVNWNGLIRDGFDYDDPAFNVSSAYSQSWLLVHYAMLGDDFAHVDQLREYLGRVLAGEPSLPAFERAFGADPQSLWSTKLRQYSQRIKYVVYDFDPDSVDLSVRKSDVNPEQLQALFGELDRLTAPPGGR